MLEILMDINQELNEEEILNLVKEMIEVDASFIIFNKCYRLLSRKLGFWC
jgi:hypothetical protein